jgi:hypothetical protein
VGSWTSKDADRTRKLQQRKAAEKEINDATIVRAQATVIERSALETRVRGRGAETVSRLR